MIYDNRGFLRFTLAPIATCFPIAGEMLLTPIKGNACSKSRD